MNFNQSSQNNILYKSDSFNTYSYYVIYPILIVVCAYFIYKIISYGDLGLFPFLMLLILFYGFAVSLISLIKLRYVEVYDDKISVKSLFKNYEIKYENIEHVYDVKYINGLYIIIWYKDPSKDKSKVIYIKPKYDPKLSVGSSIFNKGELEVTRFIKERAMARNRGYLPINKSNRWFLFEF